MSKIHKMSRAVVMVMVMAFTAMWGSQTANAATDLGELQLGETYELKNMVATSGYFVAPASGTLELYGKGTLWKTPEHKLGDNYPNVFNQDYFNPCYTYTVEEGVTYYYYYDGWQGDGTLQLLMPGLNEIPMRIVSTIPDPDKGNVIFSLATDSRIQIRMNQTDFTFDGVDIWYTQFDGTVKTVAYSAARISQEYLYINNVDTYMRNLLNTKTIQPLSKFGFVVKGIKSKDGNFLEGTTDGNYAFDYTISGIPVVITRQQIPTEFLSYWPKGDQAGIVTLEFSEPILASNPPILRLKFGNDEGDIGVDKYVEDIVCQVNGKVLTADLTGKRRSMDDMFTTTPEGNRFDLSMVNIWIGTICDELGIPIQTSGQGTVGSVSFGLPYRELEKASVSCDPIPEKGATLTDTKVSMWISGLRALRFDGFTVEYEIDGETIQAMIPMAEVEVKYDANGLSANHTFNIPQEAVTAKNVKVYPTNLVSLDGYDYSIFLEVVYNGFVWTFLDPANGSSFPTMKADTEILAYFNYAEKYPEMYVMYEIVDVYDGEENIVKEPTWMVRQDNDDYLSYNTYEFRMYQHHEYEIRFTAWENEEAFNYGQTPIGTCSATWYGLTAPYVYSLESLESITPAPGSELDASDRVFTLTFTGTVGITPATSFINRGQDGTEAFESITPCGSSINENEDGDKFSEKWELTVSEELMKTLPDLSLTIVAIDESGRLVKGNAGVDEGSFFSFEYQLTSGYVNFITDPAEDEIVEKLAGVTVGSELGVGYAWNSEAEVTVTDADGNLVAKAVDFEESELGNLENGDEVVLKLLCKFDNEVTEPGAYTIHFALGAFYIGEFLSAEKTLHVTLAESGVSTISDVESDRVVYTIQGIKVADSSALAPGLYIINGKKTLVK